MIKLKLIVITVVLTTLMAACVPIPPLEQSPALTPAGRAAEAAAIAAPSGMIQPQQVSIDTQGLPYSWQANLVPATPYDANQPPGPTGLPRHIEINFGVTDPADKQPGDPIMYIIPVDAYEQLWDEAGNPSVSKTMDGIYSWTVALQAPPPTSGLPALPFEEIGGVNDLAVQIGRAVSDADSASKSGYRFVGRWAQDANPVTAETRLMYAYQGFTNDGKYLVSFFYPVTTASLPTQAAMSAADMEQFNSDPQTYIQAQAEMLNALTPAGWQPDLTRLDALVGSLRIEGMVESGLQSAVWQWTGTTYQGKDNPVADPAQYEVVYGSDGTLEVKADCNNASGSYTYGDGYGGGAVGNVRVQMDPPTLAACGPDSRSDELINSLMAAQDYRVPPGGGQLRLNMPAGGPVLTFRAAISPAQVSAPAVAEAPTATATEAPTPTIAATATEAPTPTTAATATQAPTPTYTAAPTLAPTRTTAPAATFAPTRVPTAIPTLVMTRTATPRPTATRQVSAAAPATRTPIPTPTIDKHLIVITEKDIAEAIAGGKAAEQGVTAQNLKVDFADGKMHVTADSLGYGILKLQNLDMTGRLAAVNGVLTLTVESMSPRGLAANLVPKVANQALAQYASQWYVEEVKTLDGRVELRIR